MNRRYEKLFSFTTADSFNVGAKRAENLQKAAMCNRFMAEHPELTEAQTNEIYKARFHGNGLNEFGKILEKFR